MINIAVLVIRLRLREEVDLYLSCPSVDTSAVFAFPHRPIATAFRRYDATLPSSAAVERLFSVAGQILIPRRCKMSDTVFDHTVFLRYKLKEQERLNENVMCAFQYHD